MMHLDRYLTSIEYEVFAIESLLKSVQSAEDAYNDAFNRFYQFILDSIDIVSPKREKVSYTLYDYK